MISSRFTDTEHLTCLLTQRHEWASDSSPEQGRRAATSGSKQGPRNVNSSLVSARDRAASWERLPGFLASLKRAGSARVARGPVKWALGGLGPVRVQPRMRLAISSPALHTLLELSHGNRTKQTQGNRCPQEVRPSSLCISLYDLAKRPP